MSKVVYDVIIKTLSPFNISTGVSQSGNVQSFTVKHNNKPYIPGSTIKGLLRSNYRKINGQEETESLFGRGCGGYSKVIVDNFYADGSYKLDIRTRNCISRYSHIAKDGALFSNEAASGVFKGQIEAYVSSDEEKDNLELAIKMISAVGSCKSIGAGKVEISYKEVAE